MGEFRMPSLGADMDSGKIVEWRVAPGDAVHRGDIVAVVDTDKADIEVEVFEDGVVDELLVDVGTEVEVGTPLARISAGGTPPAAPAVVSAPAQAEPRKAAAKQPAKPKAPKPRKSRATPPPADAGRVRASPLARTRAAAAGVDVAGLVGSGPGGAVVADDVPSAPAAPTAPPAAPKATTDRPADRSAAMRQAIGDLMARSKREIPHYYLTRTVDLSATVAWLAAENEHRPPAERLLPAALLLKATALAARKVPALNGFYLDGAFAPSDAVHLGVAISLRGGGLVAPAIHDADGRSLDELMAALRNLVERARAGRLRASEMADPTITVTNLGDQGADEVHGVIYPPQVALVGFGRVLERPWAAGGMLGVHPTVRATLAADHRVTDGHEGSRFLAAVDALLQTPEEL